MQTRSISSHLLRFKNSVPNILIGPRWLPSMGVCPRLRSKTRRVVCNCPSYKPNHDRCSTDVSQDGLSMASRRTSNLRSAVRCLFEASHALMRTALTSASVNRVESCMSPPSLQQPS